MNGLLSDLRYAARRLLKDRGFSLAVVAMLALGMAVSVAMFSVVRGVLLTSLPYPDGARVVEVGAANPSQDVEDGRITGADAVRLSEDRALFEAFGYYTWNGITVIEGGEPREITVNQVSAGFFPALGVKPLYGRWIEDADTQAETGALVLSWTEWQRLFGGDPRAVGKILDTDNGKMQVVGVMPEGFAYPWSDVGIWRPFQQKGLQRDTPVFANARYIFGVGRMAAGLDLAGLDTRLERAASELRKEHGQPDQGWRLSATPVLEALIGEVRGVLWGAFAIAMLVLLIACTNVGILLHARSIVRGRELAIAQALGAGAARLRRVLALELALLTAAALVIGTWLTVFGLEAFRALAEESLPRIEEIRIDRGVLAFALGAALLALGLTLAHGWRVGSHPLQAMRSGGTGNTGQRHGHGQRLLPSVGVAMSTVAVVAALALALSLAALQSIAPGYRTQDVYALQMFRNGGPTQWGPFAAEMLQSLRALPGVEQVAMTTSTPMGMIGSFNIDVQVPGRELPEPLQAGMRRVSPGYLDLLDIPLVAGRGFDQTDGEGSAPVAIINRTLAQRVFGAEPAVGRTVALPLGNGPRVEYRVVGVAEDVRNDSIRETTQPELLIPFAQSPWVGMTFLVRGATLQPAVLKQMQAAVWTIDPREGITRMLPLAEDVEQQLKPARFFANTVGAFALACLLLGALGVYAVSAFVQRQRVPEYGLKLAIGASPRAVAAEVLGETLRVVAIGVAAGLLGAWFAVRLLSEQLYGVDALGLPAYAAGTFAIALAALAAGLGPAWRAAHIDPMSALRNE